jgi:hypothetical protein
MDTFGFTQCEGDKCIFTCVRDMDTPDGPRAERLTIGCYVDDLACCYQYDDEHSLYHLFTKRLREWNVEDEGELSDLLGVDFSFEPGGVVKLAQTRYIEKMVNSHLNGEVPSTAQLNMLPYEMSLKQYVEDALAQDSDVDKELLRTYQSLVGALLYCATNTRPDISYTVGMLCRAMSKPTPELLVAAQRVLHYLYRTKDIGLRYEASVRPLHGYSDSDWAVKHSTSGFVFVLNQAAVSWGSKKQKSVALS